MADTIHPHTATPTRRKATVGCGLLIVMGLGLVACDATHSTTPGTTGAAAGPFASTPDPDPFYDTPAILPETPGTILKSRSIAYQPAGIPEPNPAWQLQYVTHDVEGRAIAAITTVVKPLVPNLYGHPVVVSFQHAYDSLGTKCTPSHTVMGSNSNSTNMAETLEYLPGLQTLGWTMLIPDYEGPGNAFGAGALSGHATLDAIRAALRFTPLALPQDTPVALWGYSGGALATTWAAALQPEYAHELNLVGVAAGGIPVDMFHVMRDTEHSGDFSLQLSSLFGMARAYPALLPAELLTAQGRQALSALKDGCVGATTDGSAPPDGQLSDYVAATDPYFTPGFQSEVPKLTLLQSASSPSADIYLYHEIHDPLIPIDDVDKLAARWCRAGTPLSYYRSNVATVAGMTPIGIHLAGAIAGTPAAYAYLVGRFSGLSAPVTPPGTARCN